jgi:pimeloyl-ACP methyl ester carboxylesterase
VPTAEIAGTNVFWHEQPSVTTEPVVYVHGVPTNSDDWLPFLAKTGGLALDLPGFGRSDKAADFPYSIEGYAGFIDAWLAHIGVEHCSVVVHDWGGVGLGFAQLAPERIAKVVAMNTLPLGLDYRWHRIARAWRTPLIGEMLMGFTFKWNMTRSLRGATAAGDTPPKEWIDGWWQHFDHGTQRAILKLYRSAPPDVIAASGDRLGELRGPNLVAWGTSDPYIADDYAQQLADALGGDTRLELIPDGHHWSWVGRPETVDLVTGFLLE